MLNRKSICINMQEKQTESDVGNAVSYHLFKVKADALEDSDLVLSKIDIRSI
jgi:hypothetical protein